MKKYFSFCIVLLLVLSITSVSRNFTTLTVGDYPGYDSDIDNEDGHYFKKYMEYNGYESKLFKEDEEVNKEHLIPETMTDYVYFSGHGNKGFVAITDGEENEYVYQKDIGVVENIKHLILASCLTVDELDRWKKSFGGSLLSLNGYKETSFDRTDNYVAKYFAQNVAEYDLNNSEGHVDAWMYANASASYKMKSRWASMGYSNENNSLCYWSLSRDVRRSIPASEPLLTFADGKIAVYKGSSRAVIENKTINTERETLLNVQLTNMFNARGSRNEKDKNIEYKNGLKNMKVFDSGALIYQDLSTKTKRTVLSMEQNMQKAYEFVLDNGGIPAGYKTTQMEDISYIDMETGKEKVWAHTITWEKELGGYEIRGNSGDAINVIIKNGQIVHYYRMCRVAKESSLDRKELLSWDKAIKVAQDEIQRAVKTTGNIKIVDVKNVMHSPAYYDIQTTYRPAYELTLSDGSNLYISAENGSVLY